MKNLFASLFLVVCATSAFGQTPCKTPYAPQKAYFTLCPPDSLHGIKEKDQQFNTFVKETDPDKNNFMMLILQVGTVSTPRDDSQIMVGTGFVLKDEKPFTSDFAAAGVRLSYEKSYPDGVREGQVFFAFQGPKNQDILLACQLSPLAAGDIELCDTFARSLAIKKQ